MTELVWDKVGDRRFETGLDRGVLYLPNGDAVPWNGLTQVTDNSKSSVKSYYMDGVKYLDKHIPGSFQAQIQAFTYPDELDELVGTSEFSPGVFVHDQVGKPFSLSYRTLIGNDIDGTDHGYKIHILYNVLAIPSSVAFESLSTASKANEFAWELSGTPASMFGIRPTSHISIDSRRINPGILSSLENTFYGWESGDPQLPAIVDLLNALPDMP